MDEVSIILTTRQCTGNKVVEVIGECEKEYKPYPLYAIAGGIVKLAKACGGEMITWSKEPQLQKFCYAFRFETEEGKKEFLKKLS